MSESQPTPRARRWEQLLVIVAVTAAAVTVITPFHYGFNQVAAARVAAAAGLAGMLLAYRSRRRQLHHQRAVAEALWLLLERHDPATARHSRRVEAYAGLIAEITGHDPEPARISGLSHDLGKVAISLDLLHKPSALSEAEYEQMRIHDRIGSQIDAALGIGRHRWVHEAVAVADAYDAMTSNRSYRRGLPSVEAIAELWRHCPEQFSATAISGLVEAVTAYPNQLLPDAHDDFTDAPHTGTGSAGLTYRRAQPPATTTTATTLDDGTTANTPDSSTTTTSPGSASTAPDAVAVTPSS